MNKVKEKLQYHKKLIIILMLITLLGTVRYQNNLHNFNVLKEEVEEENDYENLIQMYCLNIDYNQNFSEEQKEFLKKYYIQIFINNYVQEFETQTIMRSLQDISQVKVNYHDYENKKNISGSYNEILNLIDLYYPAKEADPTFIHETEHMFLEMDNLSLEEGFCSAVASYCCLYKPIVYVEENEYLLIIGEIIGKENLIHYIINSDDEQIYNDLASETGTTKKEIIDLFKKMNKRLNYEKKEKEVADLDKEIKQQLANLAIKANPENENNFIIKNALCGNYVLQTSFLNDEYLFQDKETKYMVLINDLNKYEITEELEVGFTLSKIKTN